MLLASVSSLDRPLQLQVLLQAAMACIQRSSRSWPCRSRLGHSLGHRGRQWAENLISAPRCAAMSCRFAARICGDFVASGAAQQAARCGQRRKTLQLKVSCGQLQQRPSLSQYLKMPCRLVQCYLELVQRWQRSEQASGPSSTRVRSQGTIGKEFAAVFLGRRSFLELCLKDRLGS